MSLNSLSVTCTYRIEQNRIYCSAIPTYGFKANNANYVYMPRLELDFNVARQLGHMEATPEIWISFTRLLGWLEMGLVIIHN